MSQKHGLGIRLLMGIPTLSTARRSVQWIDGMANLQMPLGSSLGRVWVEDQPIADARNALCQVAIEQGVDYLFMLSDDVIPPPNALLMMLDKIGRTYEVGGEKSVCTLLTGVYWTKTYPPEPYLFNDLLKGTFKDWKAGEFLPVDMAGCDCLLIDVRALKEVPFPWFSTDWVWEEGQSPSPIATEDFYFYTKMRQAGHRLWADTAIQCLHEDRSTGIHFGLTEDMVQAGGVPSVGEDEVLIADLGSGYASPADLFGPKARIVRFDQRPEVNPDFRCDIRNIDGHWFGKFDIVNASHVLEHFRREEAPALLQHWIKLLKDGGILRIHVPNLEYAMKFILDPPEDATPQEKIYAWSQIYGDQSKPGGAWEHLNGFTKKTLEKLLSSIPELVKVTVEEMDENQNLRATAVLAQQPKPFVLSDEWTKVSQGLQEIKESQSTPQVVRFPKYSS